MSTKGKRPVCRRCRERRVQSLGLCNRCATALIGDKPPAYGRVPPRAVRPPAPPRESWWIGLDRDAFYTSARGRFNETEKG